MLVGFTLLHRGQALECRLSGPQDAVGRLIHCHQDDGSAAVLLGCLYHRQELCNRLPPWLAELAQGNDAALALAVYLHTGSKGLLRLEGDFAVCESRF